MIEGGWAAWWADQRLWIWRGQGRGWARRAPQVPPGLLTHLHLALSPSPLSPIQLVCPLLMASYARCQHLWLPQDGSAGLLQGTRRPTLSACGRRATAALACLLPPLLARHGLGIHEAGHHSRNICTPLCTVLWLACPPPACPLLHRPRPASPPLPPCGDHPPACPALQRITHPLKLAVLQLTYSMLCGASLASQPELSPQSLQVGGCGAGPVGAVETHAAGVPPAMHREKSWGLGKVCSRRTPCYTRKCPQNPRKSLHRSRCHVGRRRRRQAAAAAGGGGGAPLRALAASGRRPHSTLSPCQQATPIHSNRIHARWGGSSPLHSHACRTMGARDCVSAPRARAGFEGFRGECRHRLSQGEAAAGRRQQCQQGRLDQGSAAPLGITWCKY